MNQPLGGATEVLAWAIGSDNAIYQHLFVKACSPRDIHFLAAEVRNHCGVIVDDEVRYREELVKKWILTRYVRFQLAPQALSIDVPG